MQSISADARVPVARKAVWHGAINPPTVDWATQAQLMLDSLAVLHASSATQSTQAAKHIVTLLQVRQATV